MSQEQRVHARPLAPVSHGVVSLYVPGLGPVDVALDADGLPRSARATLGPGPVEVPLLVPHHPLARAVLGGMLEVARRVLTPRGVTRR